MNENRIGDWIETYTDEEFYVLDPKPEEINIEDIANSLSQKCRFGGHGDKFLSVAEHSIYVSMLCSKENRFKGFLHDSGEAYLPDIPRPIKYGIKCIREEIIPIENNILRVIFNKFGLSEGIPKEVKEIDDRMLVTEGIALGMNVHKWGMKDIKPYDITLKFMDWEQAKEMFLIYFNLYMELL